MDREKPLDVKPIFSSTTVVIITEKCQHDRIRGDHLFPIIAYSETLKTGIGKKYPPVEGGLRRRVKKDDAFP
jgi:hypothetical protein